MRISIREQLTLLILLCALLPLAVLVIAVWYNNHAFVVGVTSRSLSLTASLKASQIASDLLLIQSTCATIVTRILLQKALITFYEGNTTAANWDDSTVDVQSALASGGFSSLLQTIVYSRNATGNIGGLLNVTASESDIKLPAYYPNGTQATLGDASDLGYPASLYPNITYISQNYPDALDSSVDATEAYAFSDLPLNATSYLLLGPLQINESYALLSLTLPITDNADSSQLLGYMTVVAAATSLISVVESREGLGKTGITSIIGPSRKENQFKYEQRPSTADYAANPSVVGQALVHYILPPDNSTDTDRHSVYNKNLTKHGSSNFTLRQYPAALRGFTQQDPASPSNASSVLSTSNEQGVSVAVGYARPQSSLVSWILIVEQSHAEAWAPIVHLRNILLACVFGTTGFVLLLVIPMAHVSVRPIRRLRDATKRSIAPPGYTPDGSIHSENGDHDDIAEYENGTSQKSKRGIFVRLKSLGYRRRTPIEKHEEQRRRTFKIPAKVPSRNHWVTDELTELTETFNNMSDELMLQYTGLEQKVSERTEELEVSKRAAEAANESKTLFIANISHELKTPLNGVLGMCSVMMHEDDLDKIKRGLQIVHKSGDLLLNLLTDLLLFSKNQIGQQLSLEEKEFRLNDIKTQVKTLFTTQVKEGNINFHVVFVGIDSEGVSPDSKERLPALGPSGVRLKDMCVWGDHNRILQVIINLVGNALKFTPPAGKVEVRIKCIGEADTSDEGSRNSFHSKQSSQRSRNRQRNDSGSNASQTAKKSSSSKQPAGTALLINPMDPKAIPRVQVRDRSRSPPPLNAKSLWFQFEVEDSGPGIPQDMQERVFEPFVQGDLGLSKKYGGTGLGLSICSQLATLMGGKISLTSVEGSGSTFTMKIPLRHTKTRASSTASSDVYSSRAPSISDENASGYSHKVPTDAGPRSGMDNDKQPRLVGLSQPFFAVPPSPPTAENSSQNQLDALDVAAAAKAPGSKVRVLVAEDNLVNQEVVLRMLKLEGKFDVTIAKDGQEAYDRVKEEMDSGKYFDVIFMDIQMPNLDGLQSTRLIRQMGYSAPIVALTAFSEESNVKECLASGMDYFLAKPIRRPALKQVLKKFATIPEEVETPSLSPPKSKSSDSSEPSQVETNNRPETNSKPETTTPPPTPLVPTANGTSPRGTSPILH